jgi:hypothetical protein
VSSGIVNDVRHCAATNHRRKRKEKRGAWPDELLLSVAPANRSVSGGAEKFFW